MAWFRKIFGGWSILSIGSTERVLATLIAIGGAMLGTIVLFGVARMIELGVIAGAGFIFWSFAAAFVSFLAGSAMGMLFGLPTVRRVETRDSSASGDAGAGTTGYDESSSLEHIADFLTKGIVALSLTTFSSWIVKFDILAGNVTATMLGVPVRCDTQAATAGCIPLDRVPGGLVLAGYALLGFGIAYLWMRRYFIHELLKARIEEREKLRAERIRMLEAQRVGLVGIGASRANNPQEATDIARAVADTAIAKTDTGARDAAEKIRDRTITAGSDPDDPWRGVFGGSAVDNGCALSATVSPTISDPDFFQVDLAVDVLDPGRRSALAGKSVLFYLHPTFGRKPRVVELDANGKAPLQLFAWGAFTVGVLIDDGTKLELNLARIPGAPGRFIER